MTRAQYALALSAVLTGTLTSCTIPDTVRDPESPTVTVMVTETLSESSVVTSTAKTTIPETTVTTTATRWAIGDPAATELSDARLFGPYPDEQACRAYAELTCEEREDGWYLVVETTTEPSTEPEPSPSQSEPE